MASSEGPVYLSANVVTASRRGDSCSVRVSSGATVAVRSEQSGWWAAFHGLR